MFVCVRESVCLCVCSVAAQEEGVAGRSSQTVAQSTDSRSMFHRTALAHITLRRERQTVSQMSDKQPHFILKEQFSMFLENQLKFQTKEETSRSQTDLRRC